MKVLFHETTFLLFLSIISVSKAAIDLSACTNPNSTINECASLLAKGLYSLSNKTVSTFFITIAGYECNGSITAKVKLWTQWEYRAFFECPHMMKDTGDSNWKPSRMIASEVAIEDLLIKAIKQQLLSNQILINIIQEPHKVSSEQPNLQPEPTNMT